MLLLPGATALKGARKAATKLNLEATLLLEDWQQTCADLDQRCIYCEQLIRSGNGTIDHFLPMACQGGTTITNCILACRPCNQAKADCHPKHFLSDSPAKLARIEAYLKARQPGQGSNPFWKTQKAKEQLMRRTRTITYTLGSGIELSIQTGQQFTLQLRQPPTEEMPETAGGEVSTPLTLSERLEIMQLLLASLAS